MAEAAAPAVEAAPRQIDDNGKSLSLPSTTPSLDVIGEEIYNLILPLIKEAHVPSMDKYNKMYKRSVEDPEGFWGEIAKQFRWHRLATNFLSFNFNVNDGPIFIKWMEGAQTNICYNVLDRIIEEMNGRNTVAFYWEGDQAEDNKAITYGQLLVEVCKFANVLKAKGVKKGDRVAIYLPMILELVVAMLACARIGAVHSIVFAGFLSQALAERLVDSKCVLLITADGYYRDGTLLEMKPTADKALAISKRMGHAVPVNIVVRRLPSSEENGNVEPERPSNIMDKWNVGVDVWWHEEMEVAETTCEPEWVDAEHPLFILYTSGSTGKPKGVLHTTAGYMLYTATTFKYVFDYHPGEVYWCTADIGWITGHSYITYGPMANGATCVIFEGAPTYPNPSRLWEICDKHEVAIFYTAPSAIRSLMRIAEEDEGKHKRKSLRILGSVGENIDTKSWQWYYDVVGNKKCPIVDTYWQTETGGHVITPLPGATKMPPGSATFPFFGVAPEIFKDDGNVLKGPGVGALVFKKPWPGMLRTLYGDHDRFESVYFKKFPGYYYTGDECKRDENGYHWIVGRLDDCINVSSHLLSSTEIEGALLNHKAVSEAAVVGYHHSIKGNGIYCYTTLMKEYVFSDELVKELKQKVRETIGDIATPDVIQNAPVLPKTSSGKIIRRILRGLAQGISSFEYQLTPENEKVVEILMKHRPENIPGMESH